MTRLPFYALAALGLTAWAGPALGQTTDVDTVIVTATKRATSLADTPMSLTVVDGATLKAAHAEDFAGFAKLTPGLTYTDAGPGNKRYALRGLQSAGEPEVALYYDEIPIAGAPGASLDTGDSQPDLKLIDVERVEVLRGPQGTLYGNGAMGGAIRILSHRPDFDQPDVTLSVAGGLTDGGGPSGRVTGVFNAPLVPGKLAVRLVGYAYNEGGWIDARPDTTTTLRQIDKADINWQHTVGGRAVIALKPHANWTVTAIGYYQQLHVGDAFETYPDFATGADRYRAKAFVRKPWDDTSAMGNVISEADLGWANLLVTASYQHRDLTRTGDTTRFVLGQFGCTEFTWGRTCNGAPLVPAATISDETVSAWSGEVRLTSSQAGPLQWTLGALAQDVKTSRRGQVATTNASGYIAFDTSGQVIGRIFARNNFDRFKRYAVFGETSYEIAPRLTATLGLRWFRAERSDQQIILQQFFPGAPTGTQPYQAFAEDKVFKKAELSYRANHAGLFYVQAAQGFRAGGPNYPGGFALTAPPYGSDSVWDYEAGWKGDLLDRRVHLDAAVFDIEWTNLQQLIPQALFSYIVNGGRARSQGFEANAAVQLLPHLNLDAGVTYNDARLVGDQPISTDPLSQTYVGDKLANVPDWTAHADLVHRQPLGRGMTLTSRLDATYQSSRGSLVATQNPAYFVIKAYALADAHLALDRGSAWSLSLDVENLFDRFAPLAGRAEDSNLVRTVTPARPRTVWLGLTVRH